MGAAAVPVAIAGGTALGGLLASKSAGKSAERIAAGSREEAAALYAQAKAERDEAVKYLESIGVPNVEAQRIILETPELVGLESYHSLSPSEFENISLDPRLREAQMGALNSMQEMSQSGLTAGERAAQELGMQKTAGFAQARDAGLKQNLAEQGMLDSGAQIAMRQSAGQAAAQQASVEQMMAQQAAQQRALQAMTQSAQLGGQIRGQDYEQEAQRAQAADAISRFNTAQLSDVERANLARRQDMENQRVTTANQQEQYNKGLIQQDYANRFGKGQAIANARTGNASALGAQAGQQLDFGQKSAQGKIDQGAATSKLIGDLGGAGISAWGSYNKPAPVKSADGGIMYNKYAGGGLPVPGPDMGAQEPTGGSVFTGEEFAGDRVDAKVNSGEMILNLEQQQRLLEMLKGYRSLAGLGDENIVEPSAPGQMPTQDFDPGASEQMVPPTGQYGHGGVTKGAISQKPKQQEVKPRGLHESHQHYMKQKDSNEKQTKDAKAKIKALEVLMGYHKA